MRDVVVASGPNLLIRALWFLFVGWWLGGIVVSVAWLLNVTIIGLPLGLYLLNRLPTVFTLRPQEQSWRRTPEGAWRQGTEQLPLLLRAVYFLLVGWWLSGLWLAAAYAVGLTIVGLPLSFVMFNYAGAVTTLYRS